MKKIFLLGAILLFLTGCTTINKSSIDGLIGTILNSRIKTVNVSRYGYRYYLPKGLSIKTSNSFNEVFVSKKNKYYLYVDVVSYNNKTNFTYEVNRKAKFSKAIDYQGKKGYIEINNYKNDKYLIEIMYNYAKIEVVGYEKDFKEIVTYAMDVISSITYNDNVIKNYLSNNILESSEEQFDIFEIVGSDNYLQFRDDVDEEDTEHDPDYIK